MRCNRLTFVILIVFLSFSIGTFTVNIKSVEATTNLIDSYGESNQDYLIPILFLHPTTSVVPSEVGQSFTSLSTPYNILSVKFYLCKVGSPTGMAHAVLYAHSGIYGTFSAPTGSPLATSENFDVSTLPSYPTLQLETFTFNTSQQYTLAASTYYCIDFQNPTSGTINSTNYILFGYDGTSPTHSGNYFENWSSGWHSYDSRDAIFYVYGLSSFWHSVENWNFNLQNITVGWHPVETWSFSISSVTAPPTYSDVLIQITGSGTTNPTAGEYASTYLVGDTLYVNATPSSGWFYVKMQRNGVDWTTANPGQFLGLTSLEVITVVFRELPKLWHSVEQWDLNLQSNATGWHNVETWNFSVRSFGLGFKNVETWNFNVASTGTGFHNVEAWLFNVSTGVPSWRNVEWWNVSLNTTTYGWHDVECWNLTANFTSTFQDVEWWSFGISTKSMGWHDAEVWNLTAQVFHRGLAWPAHVPFFLEDYNTYVDFDETAYFDSFALYSDRVEFFNVSMGIGMPIPDFTVATNNANMTFTTIDYLHSVGFDVWKSPVIWLWVQWHGYFWGMDDPEELFIPSATWANTTWPEGSFWEMNVADHLLSAHWLLPPDFSVLFDWGAGPSQFREVETWTLYPYTGTSPDIPGVFSFPIMSIMGIIGLLCMFGGPLYGISKFKKKEYYSGAIVGLIFFVLGFALFIAWLWSG